MISRGAFRHVESELFAYPDTKREIERIRDGIMTRDRPNDENSLIRSGRIGDPTGTTATLLVMDRKLEQLERLTETIDGIVNVLTAKQRQLMHMRYWTKPQTRTWDGIALELDVSRRTAIYWRDKIVERIAEKMGWR